MLRGRAVWIKDWIKAWMKDRKRKREERMRKKIILLACTALMFVCMAMPVFAAEDTVKVTINGKQVQFDQTDGAPFVDNEGRTQVPMRKTMEALGCMVAWNQEQRTASVTKDLTALNIHLGTKEIDKYVYHSKGGGMSDYTSSQISNDTAAMMKDNRVYLPIRVVAEAYGGTVLWNKETKTVAITIQPEPVNPRTMQAGTSGISLDLTPLSYLGGTLESIKAAKGQPVDIYSLYGGIWYEFSTGESFGFPLEEIFNDTGGALNPKDEASYSIKNRCIAYEGKALDILKGINRPLYQTDIETLFGGKATYNFEHESMDDAVSYYEVSVTGQDKPLKIVCDLNGRVEAAAWISGWAKN